VYDQFGVSSRLYDYSIFKISDDFACTVQPSLAYYTQPVAKDIPDFETVYLHDMYTKSRLLFVFSSLLLI
jgi:hypothetical protein